MSSAQKPKPAYGASTHYLGGDGESYFSIQNITSQVGALWNLFIWSSYIHQEDNILDFGCGGGNLLVVLPGKFKVGVEINPAARHFAEQLDLIIYPTLLEVPDYSFTRVISSHALEHVENPIEALRQMVPLIDSKGMLCLLLPLDDWRSAQHRAYKPKDIHRHLHNWTPQNLGNMLDEAGYIPVSINVITDAMPPNLSLVKRLLDYPLLRRVVGNLMSRILRRRQLFAVAIVGTSK